MTKLRELLDKNPNCLTVRYKVYHRFPQKHNELAEQGITQRAQPTLKDRILNLFRRNKEYKWCFLDDLFNCEVIRYSIDGTTLTVDVYEKE